MKNMSATSISTSSGHVVVTKDLMLYFSTSLAGQNGRQLMMCDKMLGKLFIGAI